jgi:hypothetical protein
MSDTPDSPPRLLVIQMLLFPALANLKRKLPKNSRDPYMNDGES